MNASAPVVDPEESSLEVLRRVVQYAYPAILLFAFIIVGATDSILTAIRKEDVGVPTIKGPGGKPLPVTKRKRGGDGDEDDESYSSPSRAFFRFCMMVVTFTFFCAGAAIAARALYHRTKAGGHGWWCGQSKTVSPPSSSQTAWVLPLWMMLTNLPGFHIGFGLSSFIYHHHIV